MALPSTRFEFRVALSNVDRGIDVQKSAIAARHPSETAEHLMLRVLAWCLLFDDRLEFGPGLCDPDAADLWTRDLTGQVTAWVECGTADADKVRHVLLHHGDATVHAVLADDRRRDELKAGVAGWKKPPRGRGGLCLWRVDRDLLVALAAREERRQAWNVTVVGGHMYVESDGQTFDGAVEQEWLVGAPPGR